MFTIMFSVKVLEKVPENGQLNYYAISCEGCMDPDFVVSFAIIIVYDIAELHQLFALRF